MLKMKAHKKQSPSSDPKMVIAQGLWNVFEYDSPDTPARVAQAVLIILERAGYEIRKVADANV